MYADDAGGFYPESGRTISWNTVTPDSPTNSWMQQIFSYTRNTNVYHCPANKLMPPEQQSWFNYFNGARAAYVAVGGAASVDGKKILFPVAQVLSGDTLDFTPDDADKDDYTQNCVGGAANGSPFEIWQIHSKGQNVMFADGHSKWYKGFNPSDMTFAYTTMTNWINFP